MRQRPTAVWTSSAAGPAVCYTGDMSDTPGNGSPHLDVGEVRHTLTIYNVERELERSGVGRSHRQVIRYCETGMLDAVKVPGPTGEQGTSHPHLFPKPLPTSSNGKRRERAAPRHSLL